MQGLPKAQNTFLMFAILAVSLNLRPAITATGPLTNPIFASTGMNSTDFGLLALLPVSLMGVGALSVRLLRKTLGERFGIGCGVLFLAVSCASRLWLNSAVGLFLTAAGAGIGISLVQALAPSLIKRNFAGKTGGAIGLFCAGSVSGAAIAVASAAGLADRFGWETALALLGIPSFLALAIWPVASRSALFERQPPFSSAGFPVKAPAFWRCPRSWSLLVFFGIGTGAFMLTRAWLPPYYVASGQSPQTASHLLAGLIFIEALAALSLSASIHHFPDRRGPLVTCLMLILAGLACLLIRPIAFAIPAILLLGAGIGALFPLSIIVAIDHVNDPTIAGDFTAFVQGGGYIIASLVPLIADALRDASGDLSQAWSLMAIGIIGLILLALGYSPDSYLKFRQRLNTQGT